MSPVGRFECLDAVFEAADARGHSRLASIAFTLQSASAPSATASVIVL